MKRIAKGLSIALLAASLPASVMAATPHGMTKSVALHVTQQLKDRAGFAHVMASAKLRYTQHDVYINLTTDNLPNPAALGKKVYVLFAANGAMTEKVGVLHVSGNMAGVKGEVMMTKIQDLYVYAEGAANMMRPHGTVVLAAMVG